jgi:hypothetical protein
MDKDINKKIEIDERLIAFVTSDGTKVTIKCQIIFDASPTVRALCEDDRSKEIEFPVKDHSKDIVSEVLGRLLAMSNKQAYVGDRAKVSIFYEAQARKINYNKTKVEEVMRFCYQYQITCLMEYIVDILLEGCNNHCKLIATDDFSFSDTQNKYYWVLHLCEICKLEKQFHTLKTCLPYYFRIGRFLISDFPKKTSPHYEYLTNTRTGKVVHEVLKRTKMDREQSIVRMKKEIDDIDKIIDDLTNSATVG